MLAEIRFRHRKRMTHATKNLFLQLHTAVKVHIQVRLPRQIISINQNAIQLRQHLEKQTLNQNIPELVQ